MLISQICERQRTHTGKLKEFVSYATINGISFSRGELYWIRAEWHNPKKQFVLETLASLVKKVGREVRF